MWKDRPAIIELAKEFVAMLDKHNIWYAVACGTLLGAVRNQGMIPWDDDFDIFMKPEGYEKLKKLFPNRVIDTDNRDYPLLIPKFMKNSSQYLESAVFVDIFLIVTTNQAKINKFNSFKNKTRFAMQAVHSLWYPFNLGSKILKIISWAFKKIPTRITYKEAVNLLRVKDGDLHYTIDNPIDPEIVNKNELISFTRKQVDFEDFKVFIPIEYEKMLINKYGKDYMIPKQSERSIEHINAISIIKVNRKRKKY